MCHVYIPSLEDKEPTEGTDAFSTTTNAKLVNIND